MMRHRLAAAAILLAAVAFNLAVLWPEVRVDTPTLNDETLHLALVARAAEALDQGQDPTDPWVPYFVEGYPLFHHYQHLPHVATAIIFKLLGGAVPLSRLMDVVRVLLLSTFPISIYWAGRRLGFAALPAALAGSLASLLATNGLYGLDWASYLWRGYGLYTQLWGMWLIGPAIAGLWVTLRDGRAYAGTAALLAALLLSHTVLGYAALLSGGMFLFLAGRPAIWPRVKRLFLVGLLVLVAASYFLVPFVLDRLYMNRSIWEDPGKYNAYGWEWTLKTLARGELLDYGRFPALTLLGALGLAVCLVRWRRDERYRLIAVFFLFWLLLYFGRPTWGVLLNLLPLGGDLHLHRLIALVHLGAMALIGVGVTWLLGQAARGLGARRQAWRLAGALALAGLLVPVYAERVDYAAVNGRWLRDNAAAFEADGGQMAALLADMKARPAARAYAGRGANWGKDYTIGSVPVYALLALDQIDSPGYLYHALSLNADIEGYLDEARPATFNLFNLRYAILPAGREPPAGARPLATYGRHELYEIDTTGYFDLVDSDLLLYGSRDAWFEAARTWLQSSLVEARQHPQIVLGPRPAGSEQALALPLALAPQLLGSTDLPARESCGRIIAEEVFSNAYYVEFNADRGCWLLLKATYHPGWRAELDGRQAGTAMLAPSFIGVPVEPGHHQVLLTYDPGPLRPVLLVVGLAVLLLAAAAEWQGDRLRGAASRKKQAASGEQQAARNEPQETSGEQQGEMSEQAAAELAPARGRLSRLARLSYHHASRITHHASRITSYPLLVLLFALLAGLPLLQLKQMTGHDAFEYLPRTIEFFRGLAEGQVLPRWAPDLSSGYGQPFFIFNPPAVYYLASAFHGLGASVVAGLDLACLLLLAIAGLGMYVYGRDLLGRAGGLAAGAAYVMAPFTLVNLYVRQALADYTAMAFIPWALWGLYRWVRPKEDGPRYAAVAAVATAMILLSSNPVALLAVPVLVLYAAWLAWRAGAGRRRPALGRAALAVALGVGLSAFFWLPALAERDWVQTGRLLSGYLNYRNHFVYLHQLVYSPWGYGLSTAGPDDGMSFSLGPVHLAMLAAALVLAMGGPLRGRVEGAGRPGGSTRARLREHGEAWAHLWFFVAVLALVAFLATDNSIWLWDGLPLLQYLEFPWRILVLAAAATAFICGVPFVIAPRRLRAWLLVAVLGGLLAAGMARARPQGYYDTTDAEYSPAQIAAKGIEVTTAREYEPVAVQTRPEQVAPQDRLILVGGKVRVLRSAITGTRYEWLIEADGPAQLQVATFSYPGWRLAVDGKPRPLTMQNPYGLMDWTLESGMHEVVVEFGSTPLRTAALTVSAAAALLLLGLAALPRARGHVTSPF